MLKLSAFAVMAATAALASAAQAGEVEINNAVARVVVIPEDRTDIEVTIDQGSAGLPALEVRRRGDDVIIEGGLDRRIRNCRSEGFNGDPMNLASNVTVTVRDLGTIRMADAPLIVVRTPMNVEIDSDGAVWGAIGRADSVDLGAGGCGDWTVGNVAGDLSVGIGGSGDVRTGTARALDASIGGSGDIRTGAVTSADIAIGGSGDVAIATVDGDVDIAIGGAGDVSISGGRAARFDVSIAGSGDVRFDGQAGDVDATIVGVGDVRIARVSGRIDRTIMGSGSVRVGE